MTQLEAVCLAFMEAQHDTLWGRAWDLSNEGNKEKAAIWLAKQCRGIQEVIRQHDGH